jgi:8-oxo-dGTP pyrophosphatase MutT (NUDIX family)
MEKSSGFIVFDGADSSNVRFLLVNQGGNALSPPKGRVEEGETLMGAARRELREETGYIGYPEAAESTIFSIMMHKAWGKRSGKPRLDHGRIGPSKTLVQQTIVRNQYDPEEQAFTGPPKEVTYFLARSHVPFEEVNFSGERDPLITELRFVPMQELKLLCVNKPGYPLLHAHDYLCMGNLYNQYLQYLRRGGTSNFNADLSGWDVSSQNKAKLN